MPQITVLKRGFIFFTVPALIGQTPRGHTGSFPMSTCKFFGFLKYLKGLRYALIQSHLILECIYFETSGNSLLQHREWISKVFPNTVNGFPTSSTCIAPPWEMPLQSRIDISAPPKMICSWALGWRLLYFSLGTIDAPYVFISHFHYILFYFLLLSFCYSILSCRFFTEKFSFSSYCIILISWLGLIWCNVCGQVSHYNYF